MEMRALIRTARENHGLTKKQVATTLGIDASLLTRFEKGTRLPTSTQLLDLATALKIDFNTLEKSWLTEKIWREFKSYPQFPAAISEVQERAARYFTKKDFEISEELYQTLEEIDDLRNTLNARRPLDSYRVAEALELEYTFESNKIEGNTLTLQETDLVVNEGLTISGKSMREHLEAVNHTEAIAYVKQLVEHKQSFTERDLLQIHRLILKSIDNKHAGVYRRVQVMITGSKHTPPPPFQITLDMERYFLWYEREKNRLHPLLLAAEMHERLVTIHPFIDGNGRTARLVMNLILLQNGYIIANIKGNNENRLRYYRALEEVQINHNKEAFHQFILQTEKESLVRYLSILQG